jgi:glucose/mannose transport system substrate-binding protein
VTLYYWWSSVSEMAALDALVQAFKEKYPGVTVTRRPSAGHRGGGGMFWRVSQAVSAGGPSSIFQVHTGAPLRPYVDGGLLAPIDEVWTASGLEKVAPAMLRKMCTLDGHYYSVPANVHRDNLVWYNKALLERHGVDPGSLTTWDALWKAADKLRAGGLGSPLQIGEDWTLSVGLESILAGLGIEVYEDWINGKITAGDDPRLLEGFGVLKRYLSYANPDHARTGWDTTIKRLIQGETALCLMGDWANGEFQLAKLRYGRDYGAFPAPGTKGMYAVAADSFAQTRSAASGTSSGQWLTLAASRDGQDAFNSVKGSISVRTDADVTRYDSYQRAALADFKAARHFYPNIVGATHDAFKSGLDALMRDFAADLDVKKAAAAVAALAAQSQNKFRQSWSL